MRNGNQCLSNIPYLSLVKWPQLKRNSTGEGGFTNIVLAQIYHQIILAIVAAMSSSSVNYLLVST